jgi:hypothetical protein
MRSMQFIFKEIKRASKLRGAFITFVFAILKGLKEVSNLP